MKKLTLLAVAMATVPMMANAAPTKTTQVTKVTTTKVTKVVKRGPVRVTKVTKVNGKPAKVTTTTTTVTKPTVTTTVVKPATKPVTKPISKPAVVINNNNNANGNHNKPAQTVTIQGVAHVDATNTYTNNNGVLYGPSLANVRGTHELNVKNGDINKVVIGNQTIDLLPQEKNRNGFTVKHTGTTTLNAGHNLKYAKYGNYMINNAKGGESSSAIFYQGVQTAKENMPKSGTATYRGKAIQTYVDAKNPSRSASSLEGKSEFKADFGAKRITGTITPDNRRYGATKLAGSIQDNRIVGDDVGGYRSMEGRFFGPNAEEIAGRYDVIEHGKQYINGTFGASK